MSTLPAPLLPFVDAPAAAAHQPPHVAPPADEFASLLRQAKGPLSAPHSTAAGNRSQELFSVYATAHKVRDAALPLRAAGLFHANGLPFAILPGELQLSVHRDGEPASEPVRIPIRPETSLRDIANAIASVPGLRAAVNAEGRLEITATSPEVKFSLHDQGTGVLSALGRDNPELRRAFGDFVGQTFFGQLLASLRKSVGKAPYFNGGQTEKIFTGQLDQVLAEKLSQAQLSGGRSFADAMYEHTFLHPRQAG